MKMCEIKDFRHVTKLLMLNLLVLTLISQKILTFNSYYYTLPLLLHNNRQKSTLQGWPLGARRYRIAMDSYLSS